MAVAFFGVGGGGYTGDFGALEWPRRRGKGEEEGMRRREVGKWDVKRDGTTSLCILWMRRKWRRGELNFYFILFDRNRRVPGSL